MFRATASLKFTTIFLMTALMLSACSDDTASQKTPLTPEETVTLDRIFTSNDFDSEFFGGTVWLKDNSGYTRIERSTEMPSSRDVVLYTPGRETGEVIVSAADLIPAGRETPLSVRSFSWSDNGELGLVYTNTKQVWRNDTQGDYWILDKATGSLRQVGQGFPPSSLMFAKFSPDASKIAYVQKTGEKIHDIYVENVDGSNRTRLTSDGSELVINGTFDWAYEEEFGLQDGFRWSPDGSKIAYWQLDTTGVKDFTLIDNTTENYPILKTFSYPKVGETNSAARIGVVRVDGGMTTWMKIPGFEREHYIAWMEWAANSDEIAVQQLNRRQNTNKLIFADARTGESRLVLQDQDDAWLDVVNDFTWLDDGEAFLWISEQDGWRQIYRVSRDGSSMENITPGAYDVVRIRRIDTDGGYIYFDASPTDPQRNYLYRIAIDGSTEVAERLTPADLTGSHRYTVSHDGKWAFHTWSSREMPTKMQLVSLPDHEAVQSFYDNAELQQTWNGLAKGTSEFFQVKASDGTPLEGFMRYPVDFDPTKKYPVIVFVYGEPAGSTASDRWSREWWEIMMNQKGYFTVTVDSRGQPVPKGRDWRKSIYRQLGLINIDDQADAVTALLSERPYLDASRVGIWGHSGGGTSTLHALFRHGDIFSVGVSRAPVPDTRLYDTIYQERYSGILPDDAEFYEKSIAINYAHQLKGKLLLIHGTGDDNVHYQGSERLINKLIEHNIQFDFLAYPNRRHGIRAGENTRRHLSTAQTNYFLSHLPAGALDQ